MLHITKLSLVCEAEYLGTMAPARAAQLFGQRRPVSDAQLEAGSAAWAAFGSADPFSMRIGSVSELPFLAASLRRELFERAHHRREDPVFLGDTVLLWHLGRLEADGFVVRNDKWRLAVKGEEILCGKADAWAQPRRRAGSAATSCGTGGCAGIPA